MYSLFSRLTRDMSRSGDFIAGVGFVTLLLSLTVTYLAIFSYETVSTARFDGELRDKSLSFIKVIDPNESMMSDIIAQESEIVLAPGLRVLQERMQKDDRMVLVERVENFGSSGAISLLLDQEAVLVIGKQPPMLPYPAEEGVINLWIGSDGRDNAGDQSAIRNVPVVERNEPLGTLRFYKHGYAHSNNKASVYAVSPQDAPFFFKSDFIVPLEVSRMFSCYCEVSVTEELAADMTAAEQLEATGRVYYAVDYRGARGVAGLDRIADGSWQLVLSASVIAVLAGVVVMSAQGLWGRHAPVYRVDRLYGASRVALHVRYQTQLFLAFTLPAIVGLQIVNRVVGANNFPPPIPPDITGVLMACLFLVQLLATLPAIVGIQRMCNFSNGLLK